MTCACGKHGWRMWLARCLSLLSLKLSLVGQVYSWMGDHLKLATYVSSYSKSLL